MTTLILSLSLDHFKVKELKVDSSRELDLTVDGENEVPVKISVEKCVIHLDVGSSEANGQISRGHLDLNCENPSGELRSHCPSMSDTIIGEELKAKNRRLKVSDIENKATNDDELAFSELGSKRLRGEEAEILTQDKQKAARCSDLSAFSRSDHSLLLFGVLLINFSCQFNFSKSSAAGTMQALILNLLLNVSELEATLRITIA